MKGSKRGLKTGLGLCKKSGSGDVYARCKSWRSSGWRSYVLTVACVWSDDDDVFGRLPTDSQTSARTQPGCYVRAKGSLVPGKVWMQNPWHLRKRPWAVPSEADKSAEGKGIASSSVFAQNRSQSRGRSRIPQDLFTRPRRSSFGAVEAEIGKMEQSLHKS